jgi:transposase-like protein
MASIFNQPQFQDPDKAREYLESIRWANGVTCPHCGSLGKHLHLVGSQYRPGLYKCADCYEQFTVTVGTVFERSKIGLHLWLQAVHLMCASKKGVSAKQIERLLGVTYKTAWFMCHRIREAMTNKPGGLMGGNGGAVEVDETFWGSASDAQGNKIKMGKGGIAHKMKVVSLVDRESGEKRSFHVANVNAATVGPILKAQISQKARLMTDNSLIYTHKAVGPYFASHESVNHARAEYARGDVTSNTVESSFAILKRGLYGTFHSVSEKHLQRYANEFDFRWNTRQSQGWNDSMRADAALKGITGKRLTYRRTDKETASLH